MSGLKTDSTGAIAGGCVRERADAHYEVDAKAVVLAAGGFSASKDMVARYCRPCAGMATSNQPGATGDGIMPAEALRAELRDMDQIRTRVAAPSWSIARASASSASSPPATPLPLRSCSRRARSSATQAVSMTAEPRRGFTTHGASGRACNP